jgi:hypothetical protein
VGDLRGQAREPAGRGDGAWGLGRGRAVTPTRAARRVTALATAFVSALAVTRAPGGKPTAEHRSRAGGAQAAAADPQNLPPTAAGSATRRTRTAARVLALRHLIRHVGHLIRQ